MINWFCHMYPYGNLHELNLDWVIDTVKHGEKEIADFIGVNTIKYANPILWNIESQYEANTVVVDGQTGNAYISIKPIPSGVHLNRTEYWTQIYNYANVVDTLREQIAHNEGENTTATIPYSVNNLVFCNGELYRVIAPMIAGDTFVVNSNVVKTTIDDELDRLRSADTTLQNNITAEATARANADTQLQTNITAEETARANADTQLQTNITAETTARENADTSLNNRITNVENRLLNPPKKYIMVGDSYAVGSYGHTGWIDLVNGLLGLTRGVNSFDSRDVSVYFGGSFSAGTFKTQLIDCLTLVDEPSEITDICVFAGQNEYAGGTIAQMETNFDDFCNYSHTHYPNAKIHIGFIGRGSDYTIFNQMEERTREYIKLSGRNKCHYVTNIEYVNRLYSLYTEDTIHPNDYTDMANYIAEGIINGSVDVKRSRSYTLDATDNGSGTISLSLKQNNGIISCSINFSSVKTNTAITGGSVYTNGITLATLGQIDLLAGLIELEPLYVVSLNANSEQAGSQYANLPIIQISLVRSNTVNKVYARTPMTISTGWYNLPPSNNIAITGKHETIIDASLN